MNLSLLGLHRFILHYIRNISEIYQKSNKIKDPEILVVKNFSNGIMKIDQLR